MKASSNFLKAELDRVTDPVHFSIQNGRQKDFNSLAGMQLLSDFNSKFPVNKPMPKMGEQFNLGELLGALPQSRSNLPALDEKILQIFSAQFALHEKQTALANRRLLEQKYLEYDLMEKLQRDLDVWARADDKFVAALKHMQQILKVHYLENSQKIHESRMEFFARQRGLK